MRKVLFLDKSDPVIFDFVQEYAKSREGQDEIVIFWTQKMNSTIRGNLQILNYLDCLSEKSVEEIEILTGFPIWMSLACERSYFDFSSLRSINVYSSMSDKEKTERITSVVKSLWKVMSEVDLLIEGFKDNFITAIGVSIAHKMGVELKVIRLWTYWKDSFHILDMPNQTSSEVNRIYNNIYSSPCEFDLSLEINNFKKVKFKEQLTDKSFLERLNLIRHKNLSYEPISFYNVIARKFKVFRDVFLTSVLINKVKHSDLSDRFVLFPLHVMPEATLLGSNPELADQLSIIRRISLSLPWGVTLVCKAHPGDVLGKDLNFEFLRSLSNLPNVRIFHQNVPIEDLISDKRFLCLATINGTAAIDTALFEKPVLIFGDCIFSCADCFYKPNNQQDIWNYIQNILNDKFVFNRKALFAILTALNSTRIIGEFDLSIRENWLSRYKKFIKYL